MIHSGGGYCSRENSVYHACSFLELVLKMEQTPWAHAGLRTVREAYISHQTSLLSGALGLAGRGLLDLSVTLALLEQGNTGLPGPDMF